MAKEPFTLCLLPSGSAWEKTRGISHLFEHILVAEILHAHKPLRASGYTTEDYVNIFFTKVAAWEVVEILRRMRFAHDELVHHKQDVIKEIERESANGEEAFFSFVWQDTPYEKSPLGTAAGINAVTSGMLADLQEEILKKPLLFYSSTAGLEIVNGHAYASCLAARFEPPPRRSSTFQGKHYDISYFKNCIEALHLLARILKDSNPDKHIQLSEKRTMSALILETGTKFPDKRSIAALRSSALQALDREIAGIKANINELALNELESCYFYGQHWQDRVDGLAKTTNEQLLTLAAASTR